MSGPQFCSMKISQGVRDFAAAQGIAEAEALAKGMEVKSVEFVKQGARGIICCTKMPYFCTTILQAEHQQES